MSWASTDSASDAAKHPTGHGAAPTAENYLAQSVNHGKLRNPDIYILMCTLRNISFACDTPQSNLTALNMAESLQVHVCC